LVWIQKKKFSRIVPFSFEEEEQGTTNANYTSSFARRDDLLNTDASNSWSESQGLGLVRGEVGGHLSEKSFCADPHNHTKKSPNGRKKPSLVHAKFKYAK
tara:strand:+ start:991 stop:1290 length:300 start_codon:yes stop_codon:yes gene_type:complete